VARFVIDETPIPKPTIGEYTISAVDESGDEWHYLIASGEELRSVPEHVVCETLHEARHALICDLVRQMTDVMNLEVS